MSVSDAGPKRETSLTNALPIEPAAPDTSKRAPRMAAASSRLLASTSVANSDVVRLSTSGTSCSSETASIAGNVSAVRTAVILAGGLGTRLQPLTNIIPKPLLPIGQSTVLEIQMLALKRHGFSEVIIATNYMSDYLEGVVGDGSRFGIAVTVSREQERLGTCGPLSLVRERLGSPFIVMNGDVLTTLDFRAFAEFATGIDADLTVGTTQFITPFRFGRVLSDGEYMTGVEEKPDFTTEILAGIYGMKPAILDLIPDGTYFGIDDLIRLMLGGGRRVAKYLIRDYWVDIGQLSDYEMAKETYQIEEARRRGPTPSVKTQS